MKHPSTLELFDYWNARRGRRVAPTRADIEPSAIRRVLADTFILSGDPHRGHQFRIAGTRVCALFGRELKGEAFLDVWSAASHGEMRTLLAVVADEGVGVVASAAGMSATGATLSLELLLLPVSCGRSDECLLGALAQSESPLWLGTHPLSDLNAGTHRYVGPTVVENTRSIVPPKPLGRLRHGFVVHDGGHA
jgi:hypothetical protein